MNNILVVCIGNICRSPMAEGILNQALPNHVVRSAGLGALIGEPADPLAIELMKEQGIDINTHRAQQISKKLVFESDLILVMDPQQKKHVELNYTGSRGKVFLLCENTRSDVPDPYKEGMDSFRNAYHLIEEGVKFWVHQIGRLN